MKIIELRLTGQVRGGKNNMKISRQGFHYPAPEFVAWRNKATGQMMEQRPAGFKPITDRSLSWQFIYTPEDNRRRDVPAVLDAVFHCLERAMIVADDCLIKQISVNELPADKVTAGIIIQAFKQ